MSVISSKVLVRILSIINFKYFVEKSLQHPPRTKNKSVKVPKLNGFSVSEFQVSGKQVISLIPKHCNNNTHILFFHGGGYVLEGSALHWKLIKNLATKANCKITYVDYPLAPENTYKETFMMVQESFEKLKSSYPEDQFIFMGDSAGGGLALAFAQKLAAEKAFVQPYKLVLFSPWIDLKMDNPDIIALQKRDKILSMRGLEYTAGKYSGGDDLKNYLLSPLYGDFSNLCPTLIFYGTEEILYPAIELLKNKTSSEKQIVFSKFEEMQHDWVILPVAEAEKAISEAVKFMYSNKHYSKLN